ncbi:FadR/GntR family transcriptional regulator [Azospirillum sp. ST 5-10]|uniref:FadR/GntR family transcriptional regulator n=1 Tax=unclassified Azospirillum TaxID=2630922 RepID=UPI003F49BEC3
MASDERTYQTIDRPRRLPDEIARVLAQEIETGKLRPGDRLPTEQKLAADFGVARSVIREAVSQLKFDGRIESRQALGTFVTASTNRTAFRIGPDCFAKRKELRQILELFRSVQSDAAGLAAQNHTDEQLDGIEQALRRMVEATGVGQGALEERVQAERDFYQAIAVASGNTYFQEFIEFLHARLHSNLHSVLLKHVKAAEWSNEVLGEHQAVCEAIRNREAEKARRAARAHFKKAAKRLERRADFID